MPQHACNCRKPAVLSLVQDSHWRCARRDIRLPASGMAIDPEVRSSPPSPCAPTQKPRTLQDKRASFAWEKAKPPPITLAPDSGCVQRHRGVQHVFFMPFRCVDSVATVARSRGRRDAEARAWYQLLSARLHPPTVCAASGGESAGEIDVDDLDSGVDEGRHHDVWYNSRRSAAISALS